MLESLGGDLACLNLSERALLKYLAFEGDLDWPFVGLKGVPPGERAIVTFLSVCLGTGADAGVAGTANVVVCSFSLFESGRMGASGTGIAV